MKEDLLRERLPAGALHDPDLALLHEVAVLHDVIERLDLERRIEKARLACRIERDAVVQPVDPQISDIPDPVADLGAERFPELEVLGQVDRSHADTMKLGNSGVTAGKIPTAALRWARDQIDAVAGAIAGEQRGLHIAKLAILRARAARNKPAAAQPPFDFIKRLFVPNFDPDTRAPARAVAEAQGAKTVIRTESNLAILLRHALQAENIVRKPPAVVLLACTPPDIADRPHTH